MTEIAKIMSPKQTAQDNSPILRVLAMFGTTEEQTLPPFTPNMLQTIPKSYLKNPRYISTGAQLPADIRYVWVCTCMCAARKYSGEQVHHTQFYEIKKISKPPLWVAFTLYYIYCAEKFFTCSAWVPVALLIRMKIIFYPVLLNLRMGYACQNDKK